MTTAMRHHKCERCRRVLPRDRWIYSRHTGARYCWPGEGCGKRSKRKAAV